VNRDDDPRHRASASEAGVPDRSKGTDRASDAEEAAIQQRRRILQAGIGVGVVLGVGGLSALSVTTSLRPPPDTSPDREPPSDGDHLVLADDHEHELTPDDVPLASGITLAYPVDPSSGVVKAGTLNNLTVLTRFDPASLDEETRAVAAEGIVAYSGVCPHLGCTVTSWNEEREALHCLCHHAYFDPRNEAEVITGPSPRALPGLPLRLANGLIVVAGGFLAPVGPQ
jgi:Rieske Fe-S protein